MIEISFSRIKKSLRVSMFVFCIVPLVTSCSSTQNNVVEIINPPKSPKDFSSIPDQTEPPELLILQSAQQNIKEINFGRKDPFLPLQLKSNQFIIPDTFKYHGQLSSEGKVNAFVSYQNKKGTIKQGDMGGESTNLLPTGWVVEKIDLKTQSLIITFDNNSEIIYLFPEKPL